MVERRRARDAGGDPVTELLGGNWPIPVLIEVLPLTSYRLALRLRRDSDG